MRKIDWHADLNQLADELPKLHKNLFFNQEADQFYTRIRKLKDRVDHMNIYTIVMEIAQIVAAIGDAHTAVALPRHNRLPFECYWFQEGIYITLTTPEFEDLLFHKVVNVDGNPIEDVIKRLSKIVSYENQSFLKSQIPDHLICADMLFGLNIISKIETVRITIENQYHEQRDVILPVIKYDEWKPDALYEKAMAYEELPRYRKNKGKYFWSEFDCEKKVLYINYNKCQDMPTLTVRDFSTQLTNDIESNVDIQKLVIDLRNNGGGNSELFKDFMKWLSIYSRLNCRDKLFVIVGRDTFSSALLNTYYLKRNTHALFLGEPTGGMPNHYGEVKYLSLSSSGLYIRYSTKYYELDDDNRLPSFMPDVEFPVRFKDYIQNVDPCFAWITEED